MSSEALNGKTTSELHENNIVNNCDSIVHTKSDKTMAVDNHISATDGQATTNQQQQNQQQHAQHFLGAQLQEEFTAQTQSEGDVSSVSCFIQGANSNNTNGDENISSAIGTTQNPQTTASASNNSSGILTLMQSSPPPHSYRHSRAYRHFKNPPQPHMCIRTTTEAGEELFINVLSWTRIVIPQEPSDPIPLYGGMRVPPGSPRSPPIVFAVMANPEVLKDSGRHSKDPEERRAMVELMCDFVEAMNPGVKLVRNAVILKDRDISGELKDVWNAVQAQRDREREEQLLQQRQQQHYHNITTQQMFPKAGENNANASGMPSTVSVNTMAQQQYPQQQHFIDGDLSQIPMENELAISLQEHAVNIVPPSTTAYHDNRMPSDVSVADQTGAGNPTDFAINAELLEPPDSTDSHIMSNNTTTLPPTSTSMSNHQNGLSTANKLNGNSDSSGINSNTSSDQIDAANGTDQVSISETSAPCPSANNNNKKSVTAATPATSPTTTPTIITTTTTKLPANESETTAIAKPPTTTAPNTTTPSTPTPNAMAVTPKATAPTPITSPPAKKDKLSGFLPNGCIFPRFKNSKNKDKDKEKEKDSKGKEKTLLNALKKSKEKKVAPSEQIEKATAADVADTKTQYEKNCINLENEVQKLDLNKIDSTTGNDNMFIKLKVSTSSATAK